MCWRIHACVGESVRVFWESVRVFWEFVRVFRESVRVFWEFVRVLENPCVRVVESVRVYSVFMRKILLQIIEACL